MGRRAIARFGDIGRTTAARFWCAVEPVGTGYRSKSTEWVKTPCWQALAAAVHRNELQLLRRCNKALAPSPR
jgi:hypothetical protein